VRVKILCCANFSPVTKPRVCVCSECLSKCKREIVLTSEMIMLAHQLDNASYSFSGQSLLTHASSTCWRAFTSVAMQRLNALFAQVITDVVSNHQTFPS